MPFAHSYAGGAACLRCEAAAYGCSTRRPTRFVSFARRMASRCSPASTSPQRRVRSASRYAQGRAARGPWLHAMHRSARQRHRSGVRRILRKPAPRRLNIVMSRWLLSVLLALFSAVVIAATPRIERIEPASWWVGMKNSRLQLLVHGEGVAALDPAVQDSRAQDRARHAHVERELPVHRSRHCRRRESREISTSLSSAARRPSFITRMN